MKSARRAAVATTVFLAVLAAAQFVASLSGEGLERRVREELRRAFGETLDVERVRASFGDRAIILEGVRWRARDPGLPPQEIGRVELRFKRALGGPLDRVILENVRLRADDRWAAELRPEGPRRSIREIFPDPGDLPRLECRGGRVEFSWPGVFADGAPQAFEIGELWLAPSSGYRVSFGGAVAHPMWSRWTLRGEADLDGGAWRAQAESEGLRIEPSMRAALGPEPRAVYDKYLPGGPCDVLVALAGAPGKPLEFATTLRARGMTLRYAPFPYAAEDLRGEIDFFLDGFRIKHMTGRHGDCVIRFDGRAGGYPADSDYEFRIEIDDMPLDGELYAALDPDGKRAWDRFRPSGRVDARGRVLRERGPDRPARIPLDLRIREGAFRFEGFPYDVRGLSGDIGFEGKDVEIRRLATRAEGFEAEFAGTIRNLTGDAEVDLRIEARGLTLDGRLREALGEEARAAWDTFSPSGKVDLRCVLRKAPGGPLVPEIRARARGNAVTYREIPLPVTDVEGEIELGAEGAVRLRHLSGRTHGASVAVHGEAGPEGVSLALDAVGLPLRDEVIAALPAPTRDLLRRFALSGTVSFKSDLSLARAGPRKFTLDLKLSKGSVDTTPRIEDLDGHVALVGFLEDRMLVRGPLTFSSARILGKRLTDVAATLNVNGPVLTFENIKATAYGGLVAGTSLVVDTQKGEFAGDLFTVDRLDIAEYARDTESFGRKQLAGKASLELRALRGRVGDAGTVTASGRLTVRDAFLWEIPLFASVFTLNPQDIFKSRNRFDAGVVEFEIRNRKFDVKHLAFTSETVSLVGRGRINFDGELRLKMKPKAGPLLGIDIFPVRVVQEILGLVTSPLLGVEVTGTFDDPKVSVGP
jgi:hypothetical protein